jgi:hypothetical protein
MSAVANFIDSGGLYGVGFGILLGMGVVAITGPLFDYLWGRR